MNYRKANTNHPLKNRLNPYPAYKDSGIEWLGGIPAHWEVKRLKYAVNLNPASTEARTHDDSLEVSFVPMEAVGEYGGLELVTTKPIRDVYDGYTYFREGDVLVAKITPCFENGKGAIATGLVNKIAFGTTELHILRTKRTTNRQFLFYLSMGDAFRKLGQAEMYGAGGQKRVPESFIADLLHPLPPLPEQRAIAAFLDRETARIDTLVEKKERLIELLQEKRSALISHAVTRGLDPDVPTKDSGIQWLGEIPVHWEVRKIKSLLVCRKGAIKTGPFGSQLHSFEMTHSDIKVFNQRTVIDRDIWTGVNYISMAKFNELQAFEAFPGDLLITTRGTIGRCLIIPFEAPRGILHPCLMRIQIDSKHAYDHYIELVIEKSGLTLAQLQLMSHATTIDVIYSDSLKETLLSIPPLPEQRVIAAFLDRETAKIDALATKVREAIDRLKELRSALISAAVTGKIDVHENVP